MVTISTDKINFRRKSDDVSASNTDHNPQSPGGECELCIFGCRVSIPVFLRTASDQNTRIWIQFLHMSN